jgi:cell division protein FtsL
MTPPASATKPHAGRPTRRRPAQRPPRRVSGPATRRAARPATPGGAVAVTPPLGLRLSRAGGRVVDARFLDRLLRGRVWIALLALGLMGIVFIQVSMLRLNAGISRAITSAETLHRQNSTLRADISTLDSSERIAEAAKAHGLIQPAAGSVRYLDARRADGAAAARGIHRPKAPKTATGAATTAATTAAAVPTAAPTPTATQAATPPPATTPTTAPVQQQPVQQQQVQPQQAQPQQAQQQPVQQQQAQQQPVQQQQTQPPAAVTPAGGVTATGAGGQ